MATRKNSNQNKKPDNDVFGKADDEAHNITTTFAEMVDNRFKYERTWHENNFFDDGFHYRFISPETKQVLDYGSANSVLNPRRAIPKASRQLRGVINLLLSNRPTPVAYPETILEDNYSNHDTYLARIEREYQDVKRTGIWLLSEWERMRFLPYHLPLALLLAGKHSVSYLQVSPEVNEERLRVDNYDAFDIVVPGELFSLEDSPFIFKGVPQYMRWIWNNEHFSDEKYSITPDNLKAASRIKDHYLKQKVGDVRHPKETDTAIVIEAFVKTFVDGKVLTEMKKQKNGDYLTSLFDEGDIVVKQLFIADGKKLASKYLPLTTYPIIDYRFEPGNIYQTPFLDRFKASNKVLDNIISRIEKNVYSLSGGKYWRRSGDSWEMTNEPAGQIIESNSIPQPIDTPTVPSFIFDMVGLMTSFIEEQGVTTSALGKVQPGIRSGKAIESLKESEYANLTMPLEQVKDTVRRTAELMTEMGSRYFRTRRKVTYSEGGDNYDFDIIGERGANELKSKFKGGEIVNTTILKPNRKFKVEIESGLGHTAEAKRENSMELVKTMSELAQAGLAPIEAVKEVVNQMLKSFQFGATAEVMQQYNKFAAEAPQNKKDRMDEVKIAVAEVLRDLGVVGKKAENQQVLASQVGAAQALKDTMSAMKQQSVQPTETPQAPTQLPQPAQNPQQQ